MQILLKNSKEILSAATPAWAQWNDWKCPFRVIYTSIYHLKSKYANTKANTSLEKQIHKYKGKSTWVWWRDWKRPLVALFAVRPSSLPAAALPRSWTWGSWGWWLILMEAVMVVMMTRVVVMMTLTLAPIVSAASDEATDVLSALQFLQHRNLQRAQGQQNIIIIIFF